MSDITDKHDTFIIRDKMTGERIGNEGFLPECQEELEDALAQPDKYFVQFREAAECCGFTFKEAYELASGHPNDWFEIAENVWFGVDVTSEEFINNQILSAMAEMENIQDWKGGMIPFNHDSWKDEIDAFIWDRVLSEEEAKEICSKYNIIPHIITI